MKFKIIFFLAFLLITKVLLSQDFNIGYEGGYQSYNMSDLKEINDHTLKRISFDARITENYPAYIYHSPFISYRFKNFGIGVRYNFKSTGSRISREDYSGSFKLDSKIKSHSSALFVNYRLYKWQEIKIKLASDFGYSYSVLNFIESLKLTNIDEETMNTDVVANSFYVNPGVEISYPIAFFNLGIKAGYHIDVYSGNLHVKEDKEAKLIKTGGENVKANWSGIQIGVSVSASLARLFSK